MSDLITIEHELCTGHELWATGIANTILCLSPSTRPGYWFATVFSGEQAVGFRRPVVQSEISRAASIAGFDVNAVECVHVAPASPVSRNIWLEPSDETPGECRLLKRNVYFIQADIGGPIKIGMAFNVFERLSLFQMGCPFRLRVLGIIKGGDAHIESALHRRFAEHRLHGEWFEPCEELLAFASRYAFKD